MDELFAHIGLLRQLDEVHDLKRAVMRREAEGATGLGHGVAMAHGKCASLADIYLFLGVSYDGIEYGAYDGEPVNLLFIVANPPQMQRLYLDLISHLMRNLMHPPFRRRLMGCEPHIIREILLQVLRLEGRNLPLSA